MAPVRSVGAVAAVATAAIVSGAVEGASSALLTGRTSLSSSPRLPFTATAAADCRAAVSSLTQLQQQPVISAVARQRFSATTKRASAVHRLFGSEAAQSTSTTGTDGKEHQLFHGAAAARVGSTASNWGGHSRSRSSSSASRRSSWEDVSAAGDAFAAAEPPPLFTSSELSCGHGGQTRRQQQQQQQVQPQQRHVRFLLSMSPSKPRPPPPRLPTLGLLSAFVLSFPSLLQRGEQNDDSKETPPPPSSRLSSHSDERRELSQRIAAQRTASAPPRSSLSPPSTPPTTSPGPARLGRLLPSSSSLLPGNRLIKSSPSSRLASRTAAKKTDDSLLLVSSVAPTSSSGPGAADAAAQANGPSEEEVQERIRKLVAESDVLLFMKGSPDSPRCGFSAFVAAALRKSGVEQFQYIDVLAEPSMRKGAKVFSNFPTFPQLYVRGEFIGGFDVVNELFQSGALPETLSDAKPEDDVVQHRDSKGNDGSSSSSLSS